MAVAVRATGELLVLLEDGGAELLDNPFDLMLILVIFMEGKISQIRPSHLSEETFSGHSPTAQTSRVSLVPKAVGS